MPLPNAIPQQGQKPANVSQTVKAWASQLADRAKGEAEKQLKVGQHAPAPKGDALLPGVEPDAIDWLGERDNASLGEDRHADFPRTLRHAMAVDPVNNDFFRSELDQEAEREKRDRQRRSQPNDPTATAGTERHAFATSHHHGQLLNLIRETPGSRDHEIAGHLGYTKAMTRDLIDDLISDGHVVRDHRGGHFEYDTTDDTMNRDPDRHVAATCPPGFDAVVRRLGGGPDAHSVAWAMHGREVASSQRHAQTLESIDFVPGCYSRNLKILDAIADGRYKAASDVINRAASDALADISRSFERGDTVGEAWRHVLEAARTDALSSTSRHSIMRWTWKPEVTMDMVQRHDAKAGRDFKKQSASAARAEGRAHQDRVQGTLKEQKAKRDADARLAKWHEQDSVAAIRGATNITPPDRHKEITDHEPDPTRVDGDEAAKSMASDADHCAGLDPDKHFFDALEELDRFTGAGPGPRGTADRTFEAAGLRGHRAFDKQAEAFRKDPNAFDDEKRAPGTPAWNFYPYEEHAEHKQSLEKAKTDRKAKILDDYRKSARGV